MLLSSFLTVRQIFKFKTRRKSRLAQLCSSTFNNFGWLAGLHIKICAFNWKWMEVFIVLFVQRDVCVMTIMNVRTANVQWQRLISKVDTKDKPLRFTLFKILELGHLTLLFFRWRVRNMPRLKRACVVTSLVSPCFAKAPYFNPRCYHQGVCFTHPGSKNILDKQTLIFRDEPKKGWFFSSRATCDSLRWAKRKKLFSPVYAWHWLKWI